MAKKKVAKKTLGNFKEDLKRLYKEGFGEPQIVGALKKIYEDFYEKAISNSGVRKIVIKLKKKRLSEKKPKEAKETYIPIGDFGKKQIFLEELENYKEYWGFGREALTDIIKFNSWIGDLYTRKAIQNAIETTRPDIAITTKEKSKEFEKRSLEDFGKKLLQPKKEPAKEITEKIIAKLRENCFELTKKGVTPNKFIERLEKDYKWDKEILARALLDPRNPGFKVERPVSVLSLEEFSDLILEKTELEPEMEGVRKTGYKKHPTEFFEYITNRVRKDIKQGKDVNMALLRAFTSKDMDEHEANTYMEKYAPKDIKDLVERRGGITTKEKKEIERGLKEASEEKDAEEKKEIIKRIGRDIIEDTKRKLHEGVSRGDIIKELQEKGRNKTEAKSIADIARDEIIEEKKILEEKIAEKPGLFKSIGNMIRHGLQYFTSTKKQEAKEQLKEDFLDLEGEAKNTFDKFYEELENLPDKATQTVSKFRETWARTQEKIAKKRKEDKKRVKDEIKREKKPEEKAEEIKRELTQEEIQQRMLRGEEIEDILEDYTELSPGQRREKIQTYGRKKLTKNKWDTLKESITEWREKYKWHDKMIKGHLDVSYTEDSLQDFFENMPPEIRRLQNIKYTPEKIERLEEKWLKRVTKKRGLVGKVIDYLKPEEKISSERARIEKALDRVVAEQKRVKKHERYEKYFKNIKGAWKNIGHYSLEGIKGAGKIGKWALGKTGDLAEKAGNVTYEALDDLLETSYIKYIKKKRGLHIILILIILAAFIFSISNPSTTSFIIFKPENNGLNYKLLIGTLLLILAIHQIHTKTENL